MNLRHACQLLLLWLAPLLLLAGCAGSSSVTPTPITPTPMARPTGAGNAILPNILILSDAEVEVRHFNTSKYIPITLGTWLQYDDLVRLNDGEASIFCGDAESWPSTPRSLSVANPTGVSCGVGAPPRTRPDLSSLRTRSGVDSVRGDGTPNPEILVLSPRTGFVINDRPTLAWQEITGASTYTVTLYDDEGDGNIVRPPVVVFATVLPYPESWQPLQAEGVTYNIAVEASDGTKNFTLDSDGEPFVKSTTAFSLLEEADRQQINAITDELSALQLENAAQTILLAELYLNRSLRSEVAQLLENVAGGGEIVAIQQLLGEAYLGMGLLEPSAEAFSAALKLAQENGFPEFEAEAMVGLGWIACVAYDAKQARSQWDSAKTLYGKLGQSGRVDEVNNVIDDNILECSKGKQDS